MIAVGKIWRFGHGRTFVPFVAGTNNNNEKQVDYYIEIPKINIM